MGIYIHIPFCKQACHYCNFHFSTATKYQEEMVKAITKELQMQQSYLPNKPLESIYFGGGTPSILSEKYLEQIFTTIHKLFKVSPNAEITLEANPDDLHKDKLLALKSMGINRLSIGVQSFFADDLVLMNRAHTPKEAVRALELSFEQGFEEINLDLIYGITTASNDSWIKNMEKAFNFPINHLSAYALTVEPKTALAHFIKKGKYPPIDEQKASEQYNMLMEFAQAKGWTHYEISNFALPGKEARHNTAYWQGKAYLGIGPSAHSFNGHSRQWNIANNQTYMKAIEQDRVPFEVEILSPTDQYNELVMTALRTKWGCSEKEIAKLGESYVTFFRKEIQASLEEQLVVQIGDIYTLTQKGMHYADRIASDVMLVLNE